MLASISPDSSQFFCVGVRIGWFLARERRNLCSAGPATPRISSARTTDDVRTKPPTDAMLLRWRPVRASSTSTDVSKMMMSLIKSRERELARVLLHQGLKALQSDDFAEGDVDSVGAGFRAEDFYGLVGQLSVQTD